MKNDVVCLSVTACCCVAITICVATMVGRRQARRGVETPSADREGGAADAIVPATTNNNNNDNNNDANEVEPWAKSRAKIIARELLLDPDSHVHGMPATHIFCTNRLFAMCKKDRFATNCNNLKKKTEKEKKSIRFDQRAFESEKIAFRRKEKPTEDVHFGMPTQRRFFWCVN